MPTITAGTVATVYCPLASTITITPGEAGRVSINTRARDGGQGSAAPRDISTATTIDVGAGDVVTIEAINSAATYTTPAGLDSSLQALVSGAGNPTDLLAGTLQRVTITGAISTTGTQAAAATGTYYKARVVWNNNGASASAKLRIAVNADNDVHGLMIGQNVKRRDYEMTMGDGVMLVCGVPITRLTFSADGAITSATHQLQVTFGN